MSKELVISSNRHETRVALIEDDQLVEVYFQRANEYSLAGSIHKGRVTRVLPGMQSAFVDLGLERDTFLYVSDFLEEHDDYRGRTTSPRPGARPGAASAPSARCHEFGTPGRGTPPPRAQGRCAPGIRRGAGGGRRSGSSIVAQLRRQAWRQAWRQVGRETRRP